MISCKSCPNDELNKVQIPPFPDNIVVSGDDKGNIIIPALHFKRILDWSITVQDAVEESGGVIK